MIREYEESDWEQVQRLYGKSYEELYYVLGLRYPDALLQDLHVSLRPVDVALGVVSENKGIIEGYIVGSQLSHRIIKLVDIYFEPRIRGSVQPTFAFRRFERLAVERGYSHIVSGTLVGHDKMVALFKRLGFRDVEIITYKELT